MLLFFCKSKNWNVLKFYKFVKNFPLKEILLQYKPFLLFLTKFFCSYVLLTVVYYSYLSQFDATKQQIDGITTSVAHQTVSVLQWFDKDARLIKHAAQPSIKIIYQNKYISRIIEGCNAISVIVLFIAFVVAFSGKLKQTLLFIVAGSVIIHVLNIFRIALLSIALYHYPQHEHLLHGVVFPLFIYGVVFLLWVIWVNQFSFYASQYVKK
jgi:exosortase family protein XrtF